MARVLHVWEGSGHVGAFFESGGETRSAYDRGAHQPEPAAVGGLAGGVPPGVPRGPAAGVRGGEAEDEGRARSRERAPLRPARLRRLGRGARVLQKGGAAGAGWQRADGGRHARRHRGEDRVVLLPLPHLRGELRALPVLAGRLAAQIHPDAIPRRLVLALGAGDRRLPAMAPIRRWTL